MTRRARRFAGVVATLACVVLAACQPAPTVPTGATTAPASTQSHLEGQVTDALLLGLPGALVEVLDGPDTGKRVVTDADGKFAVTGTAPANSPVTLRASKDGHQPITVATTWRALGNWSHVVVRLPGFEPADALEAGNYTVTIGIDLETARSRIAAAPCPGFPVELASRTHDARITEAPAGVRHVDIPAIPVRAVRGVNFQMFVAGDRVVFDVGDDGILEELPGFRYLTVWAGVLPGDPRQLTPGSSISIPVTGEFRYCELKSARGIYNDCSQVPGDLVLDYHSCTSDRVTLTFTKR